jgi:hypothetical protein
VSWFTCCCVSISVHIFLVSLTGMFVYRLVMSREAGEYWDSIRVFSRFLNRSWEFLTLKALGNGAS